MKTFAYFLIILFLMLFNSIDAGTMGSVDDERRDKNWDWHSDPNMKIDLNFHGGKVYNFTLPWNESGSFIFPIFYNKEGRDKYDIYPSQGWKLFLRDLGNENHSTSYPYFILYNEYHGILRYIYYGAKKAETSYILATLYLNNKEYTPFGRIDKNSPVFELGYLNNCGYIDDLADADVLEEIHVLGVYAPYQWNYVDFDVSGYDPDIGSKIFNAGISIETLRNFDKNEIENAEYLESTLFNTSRGLVYNQLEGANPAGFYENNVYPFQNMRIKYQNVKQAQNAFAEWALGNKDTKTWYTDNILSIAETTLYDQWIPAMAPFATLYKFLKGGGSPDNSLLPRTFSGLPTEIAFPENTSTGQGLYSLFFYLPGCVLPDTLFAVTSNTLPLYDKPLGIFNMFSKPQVDHTCKIKSIRKNKDNNLYTTQYDDYFKINGDLSFVINPYVFDTNKSTVKFSFVSTEQDISSFKVTSNSDPDDEYRKTFHYVNSAQVETENPFQLPTHATGEKALQTVKAAILAELVPYNAGPDFVPVQIVKTFDIEIKNIVNSDSTILDSLNTNLVNNESLFSLTQNYPNPFNPVTTIPFILFKPAKVEIRIYNIRGREIALLTNRHYDTGQHSVQFNAASYPSGIYLIQADIKTQQTSQTLTRKISLVK